MTRAFIALILSHRARADNVEPLLKQLRALGIRSRVRLGIAWPPTRLDALRGLYDLLQPLHSTVGALVIEDDALINSSTLPAFLNDAVKHQLLTTFCTITNKHDPPYPPREVGVGRLERLQRIRVGLGYKGSTALYLPPSVVTHIQERPASFLPQQEGRKTPLDSYLAARADALWGGLYAAHPNPVGHAPGESLINPGTRSRPSTTFGQPMHQYAPIKHSAATP